MDPFGKHRGMRSFPSEQRSKPSPEWNHYRIEANQGVLRLSVNGKEVSGGEKCNWRKGYIGLESEGSPTEWRNIRIMELPSSKAPASETAPEAQGHVPLYTGMDLRGWKTTTPDRWKPNNWQLELSEGDAGAPLWNETALGDAELIFDVKVSKKAEHEPAVLLGKADADPTRISLAALTKGEETAPGKDLELGKWHRVTLTLKGKSLRIDLDGRQIAEQTLPDAPEGKRSFALEDTGGGVSFANFYLRSL
jgi:hypothetical protein